MVDLQSLPIEGGKYKRFFETDNLSMIFFQITKDDFSHLHKLSKREIWTFHNGDDATLYLYDGKKFKEVILNKDNPVFLVEKDLYQACTTSGESSFICTVLDGGYENGDFSDSSLLGDLKEYEYLRT